MNKYAGWQAVYMSFFSGDIYRDVARNWKGVGYLYLMIIVFVVWLATAIFAQIMVGQLIAANIQPIVDKWPALKIHNNEFSIDKKSPYIIDIANGAMAIDFDMTDHAQFPSNKLGILITRKTIDQVSNEQKQIINLDEIAKSSTSPPGDMTVDKAVVQSFVDAVKNWCGVLIFCIMAPATLIGCMIQTLIYGGIGMMVSSTMKVGLTYGQAVRLASVALTPGLLLEGIIRSTGHEVPFWPLISVVLATVYIVFAVRSNAGEEPPAAAIVS
ncbi:MAG TPA: DUF1189 family protein [Planktothrix sp.]|jgi:hypothetical protein